MASVVDVMYVLTMLKLLPRNSTFPLRLLNEVGGPPIGLLEECDGSLLFLTSLFFSCGA
jgi:hypothetical protein